MVSNLLTTVSIVKVCGDDIEEAVREAVRESGGLDDLVKEDSTVLVKPNLLRPIESGSGIITDAKVTEAVVRIVEELGAKRIIIGEGAAVGYDFPDVRDTVEAFRESGTDRVARECGVELVDLNQDSPVEVEVPDAYVMRRFRVARTALEADVIISVPVLKTHNRTAITCGLKNMKGALPGLEKRMSHRCGLDRAIVDLNRVVAPNFTIVDGTSCMEGTWEYPRDKVDLGLVVAGIDPVAVDTVCSQIIGLDPAMVFHLQLAEEKGLGTTDMSRIKIKGSRIEDVSRRFKPFSEAFKKRFGMVNLIERNTCTGCMGEIYSTFIYLREAGYEDELEELTVIMGMPEEIGEIEGVPLVVGKCASPQQKLGVFVSGCPPHGIAITEKACQVLGVDWGQVRRTIRELHTSSSG
jgi:uncharacterized protein (DUF362 family)